MKFESWILQLCEKNWVLPEQLLSYLILEQLYCYEVIFSTKKCFLKNLRKVTWKKKLGRFEIESDNV